MLIKKYISNAIRSEDSAYLFLNPRKVLTKDFLLESIWDNQNKIKSINVAIKRLRQKLDIDKNKYIKNIHSQRICACLKSIFELNKLILGYYSKSKKYPFIYKESNNLYESITKLSLKLKLMKSQKIKTIKN